MAQLTPPSTDQLRRVSHALAKVRNQPKPVERDAAQEKAFRETAQRIMQTRKLKQRGEYLG